MKTTTQASNTNTICKATLGKVNLYEQDNNQLKSGLIENLGTFDKVGYGSIDSEQKDLKNLSTKDFLSINKNSIDGNDLLQLDTVQAYSKAMWIYESESKEIMKAGTPSKLKLEILDNRLNTTLDYITTHFSLGNSVGITKGQFIKYMGKANHLQKNNRVIGNDEDLEKKVQGGENQYINKINNRYILDIIKNELDTATIDFLLDYFGNNNKKDVAVKGSKEQKQISRLKKKLQSQFEYLA